MNDLLGENASAEFDNVCMLSIVDAWESEYWVLGSSFLNGYYTILDNDNHEQARMGIAPNAAGDKEKLRKTPKPTVDYNDILYQHTWIGEIASMVPPLLLPLCVSLGEIWLWLF